MSDQVGATSHHERSSACTETRKHPRAARSGDRPGDRPGLDDARLWDVADVSEYLRIPVSSIYKMTARKAVVRIPHIRIGGTLRFRPRDIDQWLSLLTTSNIQALAKMRHIMHEVTHGDDSQTAPRQR